jgi:zinc transporter 5/7
VQAVERLVEPPEVKHERLLVVSILGFLVRTHVYGNLPI